MNEVREIANPAPGGSPGEAEVVAIARALAEDEFNRAERFDRKALNLATVVGAFYSLSQIVVVGALGTKGLVSDSWHTPLMIVGLAATAGAAIAVGACLLVFRARTEVGGPLDRLKPWLAAVRHGNPKVIEQIVLTYETIATTRRESNALRTIWYRNATVVSVAAVGATAVELGMVLIAIT